jgi:hypothetical protein
METDLLSPRTVRVVPVAWIRTAGLAAFLFAAVGCRANMAPVLNVADAPTTGPVAGWSPPAPPRPPAAIRTAILQGLATKGWKVDGEQSGLIVATVAASSHFAQVSVTYTPYAYSITYRNSSPSLKYDGRIIHRRYNHWINQLRQAIDAQLTTPAPGAPLAPLPPQGPAAVAAPVAAPGTPRPYPGAAPAAPSAPPPGTWAAPPPPTPVQAVPPRPVPAIPPPPPAPPPGPPGAPPRTY